MKIGTDEQPDWLTTNAGQRMRHALLLLVDGMYYTEDLRCGAWEFAVSIAELRSAGLSDNDLRWLLRKGYVEYAIEVTQAADDVRSFRPAAGCIFSDRGCFIWTAKSPIFACSLAVDMRCDRDGQNGHSLIAEGREADRVISPRMTELVKTPTWDRDLQELRWGGHVVKQFKVPSPNQETILSAFQEEGWPPRIDDPLPPQFDQDPKRRLHDTINTLNRSQKKALIRFLGDGSGQGIRWELAGSHSVRKANLSRGCSPASRLSVETPHD
jgi:hypothetical protein